MVAPIDALTPAVQSALVAAFGEEVRGADPVLRPSQFADVQVNAAMALAKKLGRKPRDVAQAIVDHLDAGELVSAAEVAGPGFVNITFADGWLAEQALAAQTDPRLGVATQQRQVIPIDYSAPNVAKEMHVGHLRTTIIGDALARTLEHLGHHVIRQNHVGDWGTPFGMLVEHLLEVGEDSDEARVVQTDPNAFYQAARQKFDSSEDFATRARARVVKLQAGDPETLRLWGALYDLSKTYFNKVYSTLGVTLTDADLAGESTYNDDLAGICKDLEAKGIATHDEGALVVFLPGFTGREDKPVPLFIRKSDGGYGYGTTDVATVKHRVEDLHADRILYVIGVTQSLHLQMVYETARRAGYLPERVEVEHVKIGSVLGEDRKILKTRSGAPLRLMHLLDEAVQHARAYIDGARPELPEDERAEIARMVGIGAVKYADLSVSHDSDYVFDLDRMLALTGNTGPYLQYATARIRSIFRTAGIDPEQQDAPIVLTEPGERELALTLLDFGGVVAQVGQLSEPHRLCTYLFELAQAFSSFYEQCPVLKADDEQTRQSRLTLCALTLRTLVQGLDLLGVETPERM
ncbi:arginine--tRNA ligase [Arsenicicoccus sp. oral taxon 190]|uniref:arginine--tRNA ligase n=1 Tax=Arsenicicoccus sp. oral taxon 190 TaxID=1658671 RepID=UPI00067A3C1C|nr:arginine--tRNA ligase [Arsenicicoccus sp. oral taxon 190]AKT50713.1 arginyl-tRNA synthetase [Arsenicicoccus sp. oral taxon 190]